MFALAIDRYSYDPAKAKQLLAERAIPTASDAGDLYRTRLLLPGEAVARNLAASGIKTKFHTMERANVPDRVAVEEAAGICVCIHAIYGNAASRWRSFVRADGSFSRGARSGRGRLYKQQARGDGSQETRGDALRVPVAVAPRAVRFGPMWEEHLAERHRALAWRSSGLLRSTRPSPLA